MTLSILKMAETTIGLLAFCIMGVAGGISDVDTSGPYITARTPWAINVALPPVAYVWDRQHAALGTVAHEQGHLAQADRLHGFYYLAIGLPSVLWNAFGDYSSIQEYRAHPVEAWADYEGANL